MDKYQTILIIDDNPTNLSVLTENLKSWNFDFMIARNGESGIRKAKQGKPDLILLDVYMPGIDGFEVCQKLKNDHDTADIPIIFLTADSDQINKIKGFQMGAVDYITKPFQSEEVLARINRHLEIDILKKRLEIQNITIKKQNNQLELEIEERKKAQAKQKELEETNLRLQKAESLSQMAGGIAHLFNNYLYAVIGNLELVLEDLEGVQQHSDIKENIADSIKAAKLASEISGSMITYLGQKIAKLELFDISEWCKNNIFLLTTFTNKSIEIDFNFTEKELIVNANKSQMRQVLEHLITNAYESIVEGKGKITITARSVSQDDIKMLYYGIKSNGIINSEPDDEIKSKSNDNDKINSDSDAQIEKIHFFPPDFKLLSERCCCIEVADTGYGISKDDINKIFDPFFTTKFIGRGLGLAVVLGIIKSWEGIIGVKSRAGYGSSFMVFVPLSLKKPSKLYFPYHAEAEDI